MTEDIIDRYAVAFRHAAATRRRRRAVAPAVAGVAVVAAIGGVTLLIGEEAPPRELEAVSPAATSITEIIGDAARPAELSAERRELLAALEAESAKGYDDLGLRPDDAFHIAAPPPSSPPVAFKGDSDGDWTIVPGTDGFDLNFGGGSIGVQSFERFLERGAYTFVIPAEDESSTRIRGVVPEGVIAVTAVADGEEIERAQVVDNLFDLVVDRELATFRVELVRGDLAPPAPAPAFDPAGERPAELSAEDRRQHTELADFELDFDAAFSVAAPRPLGGDWTIIPGAGGVVVDLGATALSATDEQFERGGASVIQVPGGPPRLWTSQGVVPEGVIAVRAMAGGREVGRVEVVDNVFYLEVLVERGEPRFELVRG